MIEVHIFLYSMHSKDNALYMDNQLSKVFSEAVLVRYTLIDFCVRAVHYKNSHFKCKPLFIPVRKKAKVYWKSSTIASMCMWIWIAYLLVNIDNFEIFRVFLFRYRLHCNAWYGFRFICFVVHRHYDQFIIWFEEDEFEVEIKHNFFLLSSTGLLTTKCM